MSKHRPGYSKAKPAARLLRDAQRALLPGTWRVQWIDDTTAIPEHEVFTGSEEDLPDQRC
ncbi:DUF3564 family protein [Burkholderia cepacia]|uniref:DUF3564 family protein n=1 Tax=Burkholderia cepacia TaxID=292 RepID=UPI003C798C0A